MTYESFGPLTYECECGRRAQESKPECKHCGRPNPVLSVSPPFMSLPVSTLSIILARERKLKENLLKLGKG